MIGFVVTGQTAAYVLDAIRLAQESRNVPHYWTIGSYPIYQGEHTGKFFLPASDEVLATKLTKNLTPIDLPEAMQLITALGGLDARLYVDPVSLIDPLAPAEDTAPVEG